METFLFAGLGNPGEKYENTRHNAGYKALDRLAEKLNISVNENKLHSLFGQANLYGKKILLIKPLTFMNLSGEAVLAVSSYFGISKEHIIIIYDDIYLKCGHIRVRPGGSSGGHNGIKNIIECLKTEDFARVRLGTGPKTEKKEDLADFVLGRFEEDKRKLMEKVYDLAADAAFCILEEGVTRAMDRYNGLALEKS